MLVNLQTLRVSDVVEMDLHFPASTRAVLPGVIPNAGVGCVKISLMSQAMEHFSCIYCSFVNLLTSLIELLNIWVPLPRVLRQNSFHKIWRILGRKAACSGVMELELS